MAIGTEELVLIVFVVLILFGASAIPKLARALGRAKGEFNKAKSEFNAEAARTESEGSSAQAPAQDDQVRSTARGLGIDPNGKDTAELKRLIQQKLA